MKLSKLFSFIFVFVVAAGIAYGQDGTITGTVKFSGTPPTMKPFPVPSSFTGCGKEKSLDRLIVGKGGGVANAVVYIEGLKKKAGKTSPGEYVIDQKNCEYHPHVLVVAQGNAFTVENTDMMFHNVHGYVEATHATAFNIAEPIKGMKAIQRVRKPGMYLLECDVHPWMNGYVYVAGNGYATETNSDGAFTLSNVPPGKYKLVMWHEGWNTKIVGGRPDYSKPVEQTQEITVAAGKATTADFTLK